VGATITEGLIGRLQLNWLPWRRSLKKAEKETKDFGARSEKQSKRTGRGWRRAFSDLRASASSSLSKTRALLRGVDHEGKKVQGTLGGVRGTLLKIGAGVGAYLGARAMIAQLGKLSEAGQDYEETFSKFQAVFKSFSDQSLEWVESFASEVGRGKTEILGFMARLQDTFVPLGFARSEAARLSSQITRLGVDLASFNNQADDETIRDLTSAIVGNHEAVRKYGISITEAALKQELYNAGLGDNLQAVTGLQKVQARLAIIMKGTADAQGDATRTAGSFANQMKRLRSEITDARAEVGMEWNRILLETIRNMGGTRAVADTLAVAFLAIAESARILIEVFTTMVSTSSAASTEQAGLQSNLLKTRAVMKRVEVVLRSFALIPQYIFQGIAVILHTIAIAGKTVWFILTSVGKLLAGAVLKAVVKIANAVADVVKALVWLGDLVGLTDDAATKIDIFQSNLKKLEKTADDLFDSIEPAGAAWKKDVDSFLETMSGFAKEQARWLGEIKKASDDVRLFEVQAEQAAKDYAAAQKAAKLEALKATKKVLEVELTDAEKATQEKLRLTHKELEARVSAIRDAAKAEEKRYEESKTKYRELLSAAESAYRQHTAAIGRVDQQHAAFNEGIQERIFRLQIRDLNPQAQAESLRDASREMEKRAAQALRGNDFEGARGYLDRAVDFAEEVAQVDPSVPIEDVVGELERLQDTVNEVFAQEAQYHAEAAQRAVQARAELMTALDELETKSAAWSSAMKDLLKQWAMVNANSAQELAQFKTSLEEATGKRQVFIEVSTDEAMRRIAALKAELQGLGATLSIGFAAAAVEGKAEGGWIRGSGARGVDSVPIRAAPGEFVVNAGAASRNAELLEAINSGRGGSVTVGDVNVTVEGTGYAEADARLIGKALRREIRRGRVTLD